MNKTKVMNRKEIMVNLTSCTQDLPKDLKALILMWMKAHDVVSVTFDYKHGLVDYVEKYPKQMFVSMWLNGDISTRRFKKDMRYNVENTVESLKGFLENVEFWFNEGRFRNG